MVDAKLVHQSRNRATNTNEYYNELVILMLQRGKFLGIGTSMSLLSYSSKIHFAKSCKSKILDERAHGIIYNLQDHIMCTANKLIRNGLL